MSLPPLIFTKYALSHRGYVELIAELQQGPHAKDSMLVISELILHLERRVLALENEVKRLQDEKNVVGD